MVDSENQCWPITVYNMAVGAGFAVGDSVAIPEPFCQETNFTENDQVYTVICFCYQNHWSGKSPIRNLKCRLRKT